MADPAQDISYWQHVQRTRGVVLQVLTDCATLIVERLADEVGEEAAEVALGAVKDFQWEYPAPDGGGDE